MMRGALITVIAMTCGTTALGQDSREQQAIESAQKAMKNSHDYPWYDAEKDELKRITVKDRPDDVANRQSQWESNFKAKSSKKRTSGNWGRGIWRAVQIFFWILLGILLAVLIGVLVWAFLKRESRSVSDSDDFDEDEQSVQTDAERLEKLPFPIELPKSDLLAEARRQYEAGNFGQAIVYLFSYQLLHLDKNHLIRLTRGKTNRQYLRELRRRPGLFTLLENTMIAFEDFFFGDHILERARFESCWSHVDDFHHQVEQATAS